jgi:hypothetical protein
VRTVAVMAPWPAAGALVAGEPLAEAAVTPPTAAAMARPIPPTMIRGCRMMSSYLIGLIIY